MPKKKKKSPADDLAQIIKEALLDKKAIRPVLLDFRNINSSICDAFIICHGSSRTQVEAIAGHVLEEVKKKTGLLPFHKEGFENAEWILIDFADIVVHIFQDSRRSFYNLEQLWADAGLTELDEDGKG